MARKKNSREQKPALKVKDLAATQNPQGGDTAQYNFTNAWPSKVSGGSLTSTSTDTTVTKK